MCGIPSVRQVLGLKPTLQSQSCIEALAAKRFATATTAASVQHQAYK